MSLTVQQTTIVQSSFRSVLPMSSSPGELFYKRLFEIDPAIAPLFKRGMKEQSEQFMRVLALAVGGLSSISTLAPMVKQLGARHAGYGVKPEHYDAFRRALLWMLAAILQDAYTEEVREAWSTAYSMIAGIMKEAAWGAP